MDAEANRNRYFSPPRESTLADEEVRGFIRSEFLDVATRVCGRLACAQVFDRERFDAMLLWLETLHRSYLAENLKMPADDLVILRSVEGYLAVEAEYSRDQRLDCIEARGQLLAVMCRYELVT